MISINTLKEWDVVINELGRGKSIVLLRKGGIREEERRFQINAQKFYLYPTYEHQKDDLLKPEYRNQITSNEPQRVGSNVKIQFFATLHETFEISDLNQAMKLFSHHLWTEEFVQERFNWKKREPLHLLLLRVYRLDASLSLPIKEEYLGCKSWVEIPLDENNFSGTPVLDEQSFQKQVEEIKLCITREIHSL